MKFSIMVEQLDRITSQLNSIATHQPLTPIDGSVLIEVGTSTVNFTSTDRQCELRYTVPVLSQQEGKVAVPVRLLSQIAKVLRKEEPCELAFDQERSVLSVSSGLSLFDLQTLPADDFPELANDEYDNEFVMDADTLKDMLNRTKFAAAKDDQRQFLRGVHFNLVEKDNKKVFDGVATDGFRMAIISHKAPEGLNEFPGIIVAEKSAAIISRIFNSDENVTVSYTQEKIRLVSDGTRFTSLLLANDYPEYNRLIPSDSDLNLSIDVKTLLFGLREVLTVSSDVKENVTLNITKDKVALKVSSVGQGQAKTELSGTFTGEKELTMRFVGTHLAGVLEIIDDGTADFTLNETNGAIKITKQGDDTAVFVVMPQKN